MNASLSTPFLNYPNLKKKKKKKTNPVVVLEIYCGSKQKSKNCTIVFVCVWLIHLVISRVMPLDSLQNSIVSTINQTMFEKSCDHC